MKNIRLSIAALICGFFIFLFLKNKKPHLLFKINVVLIGNRFLKLQNCLHRKTKRFCFNYRIKIKNIIFAFIFRICPIR